MGHNAYRWAGINISGADATRIAMRADLDSGLVKFLDVTNGSGWTALYSSPHSVSAPPRPSQQHQPGRGAAAGPKQRGRHSGFARGNDDEHEKQNQQMPSADPQEQ